MGGYWGKPEATAATITPDGWLRSSDGGYLDADGYLYIADRIKDMIISRGGDIYTAEIERVIAEHPQVQDVAVIGVPDERWRSAQGRRRRAGCDDRRRGAARDREEPREGSAQAVLGRARAASRVAERLP